MSNLQNVHIALKVLTQVMTILKSQNNGAATEVLYMIPPHTKAIPLTRYPPWSANTEGFFVSVRACGGPLGIHTQKGSTEWVLPFCICGRCLAVCCCAKAPLADLKSSIALYSSCHQQKTHPRRVLRGCVFLLLGPWAGGARMHTPLPDGAALPSHRDLP